MYRLGGVGIDLRVFHSEQVRDAASEHACRLAQAGDEAGDPLSCGDGGSLNASANWVGQGPVSKPNYEDHSHVPSSFVLIDRANGTIRSATATATIGGETFDASSLQSADLGVNTQLVALVCPHGC